MSGQLPRKILVRGSTFQVFPMEQSGEADKLANLCPQLFPRINSSIKCPLVTYRSEHRPQLQPKTTDHWGACFQSCRRAKKSGHFGCLDFHSFPDQLPLHPNTGLYHKFFFFLFLLLGHIVQIQRLGYKKNCRWNQRLPWERPRKELRNKPPHDIAGP